MLKHNPMDGDVLAFYGSGRETGRLDQRLGLLERLRTQELLERYLPQPPATVHDVGGAMGVYSYWLADRGYEVHLCDITPLHIEQAREEQARRIDSGEAVLASLVVADARSLEAPDDCADVVLLMGPLYHLLDREDRLMALREAFRICKPEGLLVAAAISRYASTLAGFNLGWQSDADYRAMCRAEISTGVHRCPETWPFLFTNAYFCSADELDAEVTEAGFAQVDLVAVEGPGWITMEPDTFLDDPANRAGVLEMVRELERDPMALAVGPHMLAMARKPEAAP